MAPVATALVLLLAPLASATLIALFLRRRGALASWVSVGAAAVVCVLGLHLVAGGTDVRVAHEWLRFGGFSVSLGFQVDGLARLLLFVVGFVGLLIHVFSLGYMRDDEARARFFGGLSVFMFSMLGIVVADSLVMAFVFWELVGFSSWLLISHYHHKQSAVDAANKAFIVNRVGDFGFLLGIVWCQAQFGTTSFAELARLGPAAAAAGTLSAGLPLLLFCGAMGKSAQMPLHVWLPDAMEGPTPVSALIHAATMVAAGVYLLCRVDFLMVPEALDAIACVGTVTAVYAAFCAVVQRDIKKVLAYSTLSQLGYMIAAFGLGALRTEQGMIAAGAGAALFHLMTHAFFKALLFLGAGAVIHGCHHEQDIFRMGGLARRMPLTFLTFTLGVLALIGFPFLAGFFSKDAILYLALEKSAPVFAALAGTAVLTSFYMVRMWKIVFLGAPRSHEASHAHEGGLVMTLPLMLLAALSVTGGYDAVFGRIAGPVASHVPVAHGANHTVVLLVSLGVMVLGSVGAWCLYPAAGEDALEARAGRIFRGLTAARDSFDSVYGYYVAKVQQRFAMLLNFLEQIFLAGLVVRGLAGLVGLIGLGARALHVGSLHAYVYWFLLGAVLLWAFATGIL